jgi:hypothetical protein
MTNLFENSKYVLKECVVIGAGISGIACSKWMKVLYLFKKCPNFTLKIKLPIILRLVIRL